MQINTDLLLEELKSNKSQRTKNSLDKLNSLLESRFKKGLKDYSIASIGRASKETGGIGTVSIRNKSGQHYCLLIDAWAAKANTTMKKPPAPHSRKNDIPSDMDLLKRLDDPALRAVFGQIIAEKNKLKAENRILKQNTEVIIDNRPNQVTQAKNTASSVEVIHSLKKILVDSEIEALKDSIDETKIAKRGWCVTENGAIKNEHDRTLFKVGFINAIQKVLSQVW
ncbi:MULTISPECIES: gamma-mobile-trio protein GmtX [Psychrobacter]|uniref:gamma-mobile-trio protein GmtX n=1 Tax=Psychrobacter TaxID=497 RepID=UPI0025D92FE7|nr:MULTISPECIES: gamma-mobile-trio protein GmtX [unclassified Psychrobacter]